VNYPGISEGLRTTVKAGRELEQLVGILEGALAIYRIAINPSSATDVSGR
jgi:hypothetical protein